MHSHIQSKQNHSISTSITHIYTPRLFPTDSSNPETSVIVGLTHKDGIHIGPCTTDEFHGKGMVNKKADIFDVIIFIFLCRNVPNFKMKEGAFWLKEVERLLNFLKISTRMFADMEL